MNADAAGRIGSKPIFLKTCIPPQQMATAAVAIKSIDVNYLNRIPYPPIRLAKRQAMSRLMDYN